MSLAVGGRVAHLVVERLLEGFPPRRNARERAHPVHDAEDVDADIERFRLERQRRADHVAAVGAADDADVFAVDPVERCEVVLRRARCPSGRRRRDACRPYDRTSCRSPMSRDCSRPARRSRGSRGAAAWRSSRVRLCPPGPPCTHTSAGTLAVAEAFAARYRIAGISQPVETLVAHHFRLDEAASSMFGFSACVSLADFPASRSTTYTSLGDVSELTMSATFFSSREKRICSRSPWGRPGKDHFAAAFSVEYVDDGACVLVRGRYAVASRFGEGHEHDVPVGGDQ